MFFLTFHTAVYKTGPRCFFCFLIDSNTSPSLSWHSLIDQKRKQTFFLSSQRWLVVAFLAWAASLHAVLCCFLWSASVVCTHLLAKIMDFYWYEGQFAWRRLSCAKYGLHVGKRRVFRGRCLQSVCLVGLQTQDGILSSTCKKCSCGFKAIGVIYWSEIWAIKAQTLQHSYD